MAFIVELQTGCWLADWEGDPGRTLVEDNAEKFDSYDEAETALQYAREHRHHCNFPTAEIIDIGE